MQRLVIAVGMLGASTAPLGGQTPLSEYLQRRAALAARIDSGVVVAFGAREPPALWGTFRQLPSVRYLTSFDEPDAALVLVKRRGATTGYLFIPPVDPRYQLYVGIPADSGTVGRATGLIKRSMTSLRPSLDSLAAAGLPFYTLRDFASGDFAAADSLTRGARFMEEFRAAHPGIVVRDAHPIVDRLRARKSPTEREFIRAAVAITDEAHRAAMRAVRPGVSEREIQGLVEYTFRHGGAEGPAFTSIIGSGPNSTTLHYTRNDRVMQAGDVVVMDIGASYQGYAADVTRTVPVSGRFTPEQRAIYEIVRDAQAAAERVARRGAPAPAWQAAADSVIAAGLSRLELIEAPHAIFDAPWASQCDARPRLCRQFALFLPHGLAHGIGLEVHDPAQFYFDGGRSGEGDAFTIEPGIYVDPELLRLLPETPRNRRLVAEIGDAVARYANIGVRIEDDYLVTAEGLERLSRAPREIEEIEALMSAPQLP